MDDERYCPGTQLLHEQMTEKVVISGQVMDVHNLCWAPCYIGCKCWGRGGGREHHGAQGVEVVVDGDEGVTDDEQRRLDGGGRRKRTR